MMVQEFPNGDYFDFSESYIGVPNINETTISVLVSRFVILGGHPDYPKTTHFKRCVLIYEGVISSKRLIGVYGAPEQKGSQLEYLIESKYEISDGPFAPISGNVFAHHLSGVSKELNAWVDWEIIAASVRIEEGELDESPSTSNMPLYS